MKQRLFHVFFSSETKEEIMNSINKDIKEKNKILVCTPNLDFLRRAYKDKEFRLIINNARYTTIDGTIVYALSRIFQRKIKDKFSGSDMATPLLDLASKNGYRVFLFGGQEGVAEKAKSNIISKYSKVQICGTYCPPFGFEKDSQESIKIVNLINESRPDIVFMCCGSPKTESFYSKYEEKLNPAAYFSLGATIDFMAENIKRAPIWMSKIGLEWFYRLMKEPKRLFKRYFLDFFFLIKIVFMGIIMNGKLKKKAYDGYEDIEETK